jgi:hypothetical protein
MVGVPTTSVTSSTTSSFFASPQEANSYCKGGNGLISFILNGVINLFCLIKLTKY